MNRKMSLQVFKKIRIAVLGAGSTSKIISVYLTKAGYDVTIVTGCVDAARIIDFQGITIMNSRYPGRNRIKAVTVLEELEAVPDLILLCVEPADLQEEYFQLIEYVSEGTVLVCFQSMMQEEILKKSLPAGKIVAGIIDWSSRINARGSYSITSNGAFYLGPSRAVMSAILNMTGQILSSVAPVKIAEDFDGYRWSKLIFDAAINGLGVAFGCALGEILTARKAREIAVILMGELLDILNGLDVTPAKIGAMDFAVFADRSSIKGRLTCHAVLVEFAETNRYRASIDISSVQITQQYLLDQGAAQDISLPFNRKLFYLINKIQSGEIKPSIKNLSLFTLVKRQF